MRNCIENQSLFSLIHWDFLGIRWFCWCRYRLVWLQETIEEGRTMECGSILNNLCSVALAWIWCPSFSSSRFILLFSVL